MDNLPLTLNPSPTQAGRGTSIQFSLIQNELSNPIFGLYVAKSLKMFILTSLSPLAWERGWG
jgi:hypothetical protein